MLSVALTITFQPLNQRITHYKDDEVRKGEELISENGKEVYRVLQPTGISF